jgi:hypothetical protein
MYTTGAGTDDTEPFTDRYLPRRTEEAGRFSKTCAVGVTATDLLVLVVAPTPAELTHRYWPETVLAKR